MGNKEENVRVVYFKTGKDLEVGTMVNSVEGMQKAIGGGCVEVLSAGITDMVILCDEDGISKGLPLNRGLRGDWLIVGTNGFEFLSLKDEQIEWIMKAPIE